VPLLANIIDVSPLTLLVVLILALLILGPGKLPEVAGALGKSIREFRRTSSDLADSVRLDQPSAAAPASTVSEVTGAPAAAPASTVSEATGAPAATATSAAVPAPPAAQEVDPNDKIRMLEERLAALEHERDATHTNSSS